MNATKTAAKVAAVSINQTPLDWTGNRQRIVAAIEQAKAESIDILCFPELCITAYGCEDVFLGKGVYLKALEQVREIAKACSGISVAVGAPVLFEGNRYNALFLIKDTELLGIYPKHVLANSGVYYEARWFSAWDFGKLEEFDFFGKKVPMGGYIYEIGSLKIAFEICEDAWTERRPIAQAAYKQADVVFNASASHFAFSKLEQRIKIVKESSKNFDVTYVYANSIGNESGRLIFDGGSLIAEKGELIAAGERFSYEDFTITSATLAEPNPSIAPKKYSKEQEFTEAVSLGLFDYLRKSHSRGFVVSLSGGADSSATAILCAEMIRIAVQRLGLDGFKKKCSYLGFSEQDNLASITKKMLTCAYQATENSGEKTLQSSKALADEIKASFHHVNIQNIVTSYESLTEDTLEIKLNWEEHDISLQNIQARARGPFVWFLANLKGALLLATSNRSEAAVGYTTMDGDTCGGLSPIAGIDKAFLLHWLRHIENNALVGLGEIKALKLINSLEPTAELKPAVQNQTDEKDLMPYPIIDEIEKLAIGDRLFEAEVLAEMLNRHSEIEPSQMSFWVNRFFVLWTRNQWKRERYAPSFHLDDKNLDPKTWCRYPILSVHEVS